MLYSYIYEGGGVTKYLLEKWCLAVFRLGGRYVSFLQEMSKITAEKGWESDEVDAGYFENARHGYVLQGVCQSFSCVSGCIIARCILHWQH